MFDLSKFGPRVNIYKLRYEQSKHMFYNLNTSNCMYEPSEFVNDDFEHLINTGIGKSLLHPCRLSVHEN